MSNLLPVSDGSRYQAVTYSKTGGGAFGNASTIKEARRIALRFHRDTFGRSAKPAKVEVFELVGEEFRLLEV